MRTATHTNVLPSHAFYADPSRLGMSTHHDSDLRDWLLSSLELREGLNVREILDTLPAELLDLI
jgi:hypothetical protein